MICRELHPDPLDLVEADLIASAVVELGGAGAGVVGHGGRVLQRTAVLQVGGDPCPSEAVVADPGVDPGRKGASRPCCRDRPPLSDQGRVALLVSHHIPRQWHQVTNRAAHDAALRQRGSLTVWFTNAAIAAWKAEPRTTRGGQPRYSALATATALTLRAVFRLALCQTEGLIGSVLALLGLDLAVPDHATLSRRAEMLEMALPRPGSGPVPLPVDSRGLKLCASGEWLLEKHGTRTRRS